MIGCCRRNTKNLRRLIKRQTAEVPQFHELGLRLILVGKLVQSLIEREDILRYSWHDDICFVIVLPQPPASMSKP